VEGSMDLMVESAALGQRQWSVFFRTWVISVSESNFDHLKEEYQWWETKPKATYN
jgi:hypothetical protein